MAALGIVLALGGCADDDAAYFPTPANGQWKYSIQGSFDTTVDTLTVAGKVPVGGHAGVEVRGGTGVSRWAWIGGTLYASELGSQWFDPPLPLLVSHRRTWKGTWQAGARAVSCEAVVEPGKEKLVIAGKSYDAVVSTVRLQLGRQKTTLTTWFVKGIGILRQEQRTGERRERRVDYLSGP